MSEIVIRYVKKEDLQAVTDVEASCFPAAEAAPEEALQKRIETFPECFFVAEHDGTIVGFINGCATDERTIRDEMFEDSSLHQQDGRYPLVEGQFFLHGSRLLDLHLKHPGGTKDNGL